MAFRKKKEITKSGLGLTSTVQAGLTPKVAGKDDMRNARIVALAIFLLVIVWAITSTILIRQSDADIGEEIARSNGEFDAVADIRYVDSKAVDHRRRLSISGVTAPSSNVELRAEVGGKVIALPRQAGDYVSAGQSLMVVDISEQIIRKPELEARVAELQIERDALAKLSDQGLESRLRLAQVETRLASAKSALALVELDRERSNITAPISGYYQERIVDIGDLLRPGDQVASLVNINPLLIEVSLSQEDVMKVDYQTAVEVIIADTSYAARIHRISVIADEFTRTFPLEILIDNPNGSIGAGFRSEVIFSLELLHAHKLLPSWLTLNDDGEIGVKYLDDAGMVQFTAIEIVDNDGDQLWATGLPEQTRIISLGLDRSPIGTVPEIAVLDARY